MSREITQSNELENTEAAGRKWAQILGWVALTLFCLVLFTILKLPDDRLKSYINGNISAVLAQKDITFTAGETHLSMLFGLTYTLKDVTLSPPPPSPPIRVEKIKISPALLPLLFRRVGGNLEIENGKGELDASFSFKDSEGDLSFKTKKLDIGKLGLLPLLADVQASAIFGGTGKISGDMNVPNTLTGSIDLKFNKGVIEPQSIMGFSIPRLNISEGVVDVTFGKGKAILKTISLGKTGNKSDDVQANASGEMALGKNWDATTLNAKAKLSLSEAVLKAFVLLDAILGNGKQPDGSYAFSLTGPLSAINPTPLGGGGPSGGSTAGPESGAGVGTGTTTGSGAGAVGAPAGGKPKLTLPSEGHGD